MTSRLDRLRQVCLALPETTEELTWETDITFRVRRKVFVFAGEAGDGCTVKADRAEQAALVASADYIDIAPHVGRYGWVSIDLTRAPWDEAVELIRESYRLIAPKKLAAAVE